MHIGRNIINNANDNHILSLVLIFFFFQAEDGIRDIGVTGVQTCALPILGMADTAHGMLPESQMGFVGLARNEVTFQPEAYMASLPESLVGRDVFVLDPMLATGGSLVHCCELLVARGTTSITVLCALAAPDGIRRLEESGLPLRVFTASIDEGLNDKA